MNSRLYVYLSNQLINDHFSCKLHIIELEEECDTVQFGTSIEIVEGKIEHCRYIYILVAI